MKYEEYQVWFHAYNTATSSLLRGDFSTIDSVINRADQVANHALEKYKSVEQPKKDTKVPDGVSADFKNIVEQATKEAIKRGKL